MVSHPFRKESPTDEDLSAGTPTERRKDGAPRLVQYRAVRCLGLLHCGRQYAQHLIERHLPGSEPNPKARVELVIGED